MSEPLHGIGLDVGSTTVKLVAARNGVVVFRDYRRHRGQGLACAQAMLREGEAAKGAGGLRCITGSGGAALAGALCATYVHEVHAVATAVRERAPRVRTVIELGGQDAKMIHFDQPGEGTESAPFSSDMNERCAAGTGAVLDRCLHRLGLDERDLASAAVGEDLPIVSAKCGVFAETDLVHLVKSGVPRARALASLLDAIVRANLAVLSRGRPLPPQAVLLGGPHAFVPALATLWRRHLASRWKEHGVPCGAPDDVVVPRDAVYFAAEGALLSAGALARVAAARGGAHSPRQPSLSRPEATCRTEGAGLVSGDESVDDVLRWHEPPTSRGSGRSSGLALGIDAGSTTIKAVVLDEGGLPRVRVYRRAVRGPLEETQEILLAVAEALGSDADRVVSFGVTGYAADLIGPVFGADAAPPETLAHARSALRFIPDAEVVCDIGGQDIKVLVVRSGAVSRFYLSSQCAAGNGALLEATARDLGTPMEDYADAALAARRAPRFSVGCAVFLDTERITAHRDGFTPPEILAGMAAVLPRNVWENVVAAPSLAELGRLFVLSGGVQRNRAVVKAQVDYIGARHPNAQIVLHPYPGEAGAIGAALIAREQSGDCTRFVGFRRAAATTFAARTDDGTRCRHCPSACARTVVDAAGHAGEAVRFVTGHACDRGAAPDGAQAPRVVPIESVRARNLLRVEASRLFRFSTPRRPASRAGRGLRIAIPRVLSMYRSAPFFTSYLLAIGVAPEDILIGAATSEDLWRRAAGRGTVDACFPVKVAQAHVAELLARRAERGFDAILFPALTHAVTAVTGCSDTASCPVVAATPLVTRAAFGADDRGVLPCGVLLLTPTLTLTRPHLLREQLYSAVRRVVPALTLPEHDEALREARAGQRAFESALEEEGALALARARADRRAAVVVLARPYHADPGIHHDIGSELRALGRTTLSIRALPKDAARLAELGCPVDLDLSAEAPLLTNSGDGEKLAAARVVAAHPFLVSIELSSFKCGQDASLYGAVADAARRNDKPFLALHDLDETRPVGSLRLRLRTFLDAVRRYELRLQASSVEPS